MTFSAALMVKIIAQFDRLPRIPKEYLYASEHGLELQNGVRVGLLILPVQLMWI